jgi:hypothetical protein
MIQVACSQLSSIRDHKNSDEQADDEGTEAYLLEAKKAFLLHNFIIYLLHEFVTLVAFVGSVIWVHDHAEHQH